MKIIFVCTGNTCRSPLAEGYLKTFKIKNLEVFSRGIEAFGDAASEHSVTVAKENGFDISNHISTQFSLSDFDADKIICLSHNHLNCLQNFGVENEKLLLLGGRISDPYGMPLGNYRLCAKQIFDAVDELVFSGKLFEFKIESVNENDIKDIARLEKECFSEPWSENAIIESVKAGTHFFAAKKDDNLCGYIGISTVLDEGYITNVAVFDSMRNKGVATLLLNRVFSFARSINLSFVSLEVRASNKAAISLYEKLGFTNEGIRKGFYQIPKEDAIIMTRRFFK